MQISCLSHYDPCWSIPIHYLKLLSLHNPIINAYPLMLDPKIYLNDNYLISLSFLSISSFLSIVHAYPFLSLIVNITSWSGAAEPAVNPPNPWPAPPSLSCRSWPGWLLGSSYWRWKYPLGFNLLLLSSSIIIIIINYLILITVIMICHWTLWWSICWSLLPWKFIADVWLPWLRSFRNPGNAARQPSCKAFPLCFTWGVANEIEDESGSTQILT